MTKAMHTIHNWNWRIYRCRKSGRRFIRQAGQKNNIAELFGTPEQDGLIVAAPELLSLGHIALDYIDGDLHSEACDVMARARGKVLI